MGLLFSGCNRRIYPMASKNLNHTCVDFPLAHMPTLALGIGTVVFWVELYLIRLPMGHTSYLAWGLLCIAAATILCQRQIGLLPRWAWTKDETLLFKGMIGLGLAAAVVYGAVGFYAYCLPPHLVQENDALMYHLTLPRQHLLHHSFAHLPWSVHDLFLLPLDYALSPFALCTAWPNKLVQAIFAAGVFACVFHLVFLWSGQNYRRAWFGVLAVMACHAVAIQVGLAMLDLVIAYCFLAFMHSFLVKRWSLAAVELAFFCWAKPFMPLQMLLISVSVAGSCYVFCRRGYRIQEIILPGRQEFKRFVTVFILACGVIALPHLAKSFYYTGTPLYPFGVGIFPAMVPHTPDQWQAIITRAADCMAVKDAYGHGRSVAAFFEHFWLMAVPEQGVNNAFDYPLGLAYLLVLVPFGAYIVKLFRSKAIPVFSWAVLCWWLSWWFGSQQSRFLLVPVIIMISVVVSFLPKISRVLVALIVLTLSVEALSLINAHRPDWHKTPYQVLRRQDKQLLSQEFQAGAANIVLDFPDVAFAPFPVTVRRSDSPYVLP